MLVNRSGFRLFNEYDLGTTLENQLSKAREEIEKEVKKEKPENEAEYIAKQVEKYKISPIEFDLENLTITVSEQMIPAEYFPSGFIVREGEKYAKEILQFHLPFRGDRTLLECVPSSRILWTEEVELKNNEIIFEVINFSKKAEEIKRERDKVVNFLVQQSTNVNNQVNQYNENLNKAIKDIINATISKQSELSELLTELGTPLKVEPSDNSNSAIKEAPKKTHVMDKKTKKYDVFICHASEDKKFVSSLAEAIKKEGIEVWYDDFVLGWGDDLRPAIDNGLVNSKYGIVVLSKAFLGKKKWTEYELNGLFAKEKQGKNVILPVWHDIVRDDLAQYSPALADRLALESKSIKQIVDKLVELVK